MKRREAAPEPTIPAGRAVVYGWTPVVVLALTVAVEIGERQSLAQAVDGLQESFGVSDRAIGILPAAMILIGVVGAFPFGFLADRIRRTGLMAAGMVAWTFAMALNALAPGYGALFAARLGVGAVEANSPAAVSLLADYYPVRNRAKMMGLYQSGALVGAMLGLLLGGVAVSLGGWRWAFWMWVPAGAVVAWLVRRLPEPARGDQDADFHDDIALLPGTGAAVDPSAMDVTEPLPPPPRVGTLDYATASTREVYRELLGIRSMWFGMMALTISSFLLNGLQFWSVEYFKRVHDLSAAQAGAFTAVFGLGAAVGVMGGGFLADALLRRGVVNARVYVVAFASLGASLVLTPAFLSTNLALTGVLMVVGGTMLTLPIAPGDALVNDVVVAQLRGRAATLRAVVRSLGAAGPLVVGVLSDAWGIRAAIAGIVPVYAVGGLVMLLAARTYPADLAFVGAEARRVRRDPEPV
ncbi:MAG TPA: MFS transporter [Acidimicrobiia bacterium]|nr:MFS transporter [Acidimicrobiia bacterium]